MLLVSGDEAVAVDPGVTQAEIEAVRERAVVRGRARRRGDRDARRLRPHRRHRVVPGRRGGHGSARSRTHRERSRAARDGRGGSATRPLLARFAALRPSPPCRAPRAGRTVRDRDDGARGAHRRRHRPAPARPRRPDRRRLPLAHRVPVRLPLDGGLPQHARRPRRSAAARTRRRSWSPATVRRWTPARRCEIAESDLAYLHALRRAVARRSPPASGPRSLYPGGNRGATPRSLPVEPVESRRNAERQFEELVAC